MIEAVSKYRSPRLIGVVSAALLILGTFGITLYSVASDDFSESSGPYAALHSVKLTDQYGQRVKPSDLHDKVVMVNFYFTTCGSACPVQTAVLRDVRANLHKEVDAVFISVSIAPLVDNPTVVAEYIKKHRVSRDNWHFVSTSVEDTEKLIEKFGVTPDGMTAVADQIDHRNMGYLFDRDGVLMQQYQLVPGVATRITEEMKVLYELQIGGA